MTPVTAADLDRWEALAAAATPGPWERDITGHIATSRTAVAALVAALREALETNARLNRRSQIAEAAIADLTREPVGGRKHRSVAAEVWERCEESHGLACRTTREARAEVERLQSRAALDVRRSLGEWLDEHRPEIGRRYRALWIESKCITAARALISDANRTPYAGDPDLKEIRVAAGAALDELQHALWQRSWKEGGW